MDTNYTRMDNGQGNRLRELRVHLNMTQKQMADILDVGQNTYSRIENGVSSFKDSYKRIIEDKYHLTTGWLSGADVPMFKDGDSIAGIIEHDVQKSNRDRLKEQILNELVDKAINPQISYTTGVPYYNVDFIGGFDIVENDQTVNPEYNIDFQKYNEATCWCNVTGHSMEPEITHGDIIALKRIDDFSFLPLGEVYAIVTTNGMRTIKRLGPSSNPENYTLVPANKSPEYGVQEIPKKMIRTIYHVLGCMKRL